MSNAKKYLCSINDGEFTFIFDNFLETIVFSEGYIAANLPGPENEYVGIYDSLISFTTDCDEQYSQLVSDNYIATMQPLLDIDIKSLTITDLEGTSVLYTTNGSLKVLAINLDLRSEFNMFVGTLRFGHLTATS